MNPKCTLPEGMRVEAMEQLRGWGLSEEEEEKIRQMFPRYLFFRNDYRYDDGWNVSDPVRLCTCTVCGESFEARRGNYARGKLHHEKCNCPQCGAEVEGIAVGKYGYEMKSLERWVKVAIARAGDNGELLIVAGNAVRQFNWDNLTGEIAFYPVRRYFFSKDGSCEWKATITGCGPFERNWSWETTKTIGDPFQPNMMGYCDYDGRYAIIGLGDALPNTDLKYCRIMEFFERRAYADLDDSQPSRAIVKYLGWACIHPQIEFAVRLGLEAAVEQLITEGKKNSDLLNWKAKRPDRFMRMTKQEAKLFVSEEMNFADLEAWKKTAPEMNLKTWAGICDEVGGYENIRELIPCAKAAGADVKEAAHYVNSLQPRCARYAVDVKIIIRRWKDYLDMAEKLKYDLTQKTVAMPKDLTDRHDAAAKMIYVQEHADEMKKYKKRRRQLEKQYAFRMGGYCILVPTSGEEIIREGKTLQHCVGGYAERHIKGTTTILFLRNVKKTGRSFLTIEMEKKDGKMQIRQIHGFQNERYDPQKKPEERFAWFIGPWLDWVNAGSERDRDGNPELKIEQEETMMEVNAG